jgi:predicted ATP-grasp superfamily ATP-dependent carboligase
MTPTRLLVFEFVSGGGLAREPLPPGLAREGDLMLRALLGDLAELPGLAVVTTRDPRLPPPVGAQVLTAAPGEDIHALYRRALARAGAAWPIAPETGGVLEELSRITLEEGKVLIGCRPEAVRLAGSKLATVRALEAAGVPVVPTFGVASEVPAWPGDWVVKPDDGAGGCDAVVVDGWRVARERLEAEGSRLVAQPWIPGEALSLSLICRGGQARLLACNRQRVRVEEGRPVLSGISVNAVPDSDGRYARLAQHIAAAIPGLSGYVGVDLIRTGQGLAVLEVNPRITTSYCGLRRALGVNPAALILGFPSDLGWPEFPPGRCDEIVLEDGCAA